MLSVSLRGVDNNAWVGSDVWRAKTQEVLDCGIDLCPLRSVGGETLVYILGEVWLWTEAVSVGVGSAVLWQPGVQAPWKDGWALAF